MDYASAVDYVWGLTNYENKPPSLWGAYTLERMAELLHRLGDPHERLPVVHVAGSKGKGSTCAMFEAVLRQAGLRTGLYTSPHLYSVRERIRLGAEMISRQAFTDLVRRIRNIAEELSGVTSFEFLTAMAYLFFAENAVDIAITEVGLGGRLDATNLVSRPQVAVITPLSLEHTYILGDTIGQIASEKAGIIKAGAPAVCAPQQAEAQAVIERIAAERQSPLERIDALWRWQNTGLSLQGQFFDVDRRPQDSSVSSHLERGILTRLPEIGYKGLFIPFLGAHQLLNATTTIAGLEVLRQRGFGWREEDLRAGLAGARWPARGEVLNANPFVMVDGAHNGASAQALSQTLHDLFANRLIPKDRLRLIVGISADKKIGDIVTPFLPQANLLILTQADHPRACPAPEVLRRLEEVIAPDALPEMIVTHTVEDAVQEALKGVGSDGVIIACGSLFVAAEARAAWGESGD